MSGQMPAIPSSAAPQGYSFVSHAGEMARGRIEGRGSDPESDETGPEWLDSGDAIAAVTAQALAAGREWSFGWIRLASDARRGDLARALAGTGAVIVGSSGRMVRGRLPGDATRLQQIVEIEEVDALGTAPPEAKLVAFDDGTATLGAGPRPVYVTLMDADADGHWRRSMEDLGAVVGDYDPVLRVYRANADETVVRALAAADFVLAVEPIRVVEANHDTAVPGMGADALRHWDGAPGIFSGTDGASVPIGVMDTGLNVNHLDIASHRDSICGSNLAYNSGWFGAAGPLVESDDLWIDDFGHGTHVTGTMAGNGFMQQRFAGMAPGVRHIRFAKVLDSFGAGFGDSMVQGMDYLGEASGCSDGGRMSERVKPLVVNMSLSAASRIFRGRDVGARKLDSVVWTGRQLYVVSQANAGVYGFSNYGAAKNSLAVGSVMDSGDLASSSSHGPTADGRLSPNVVGTGVRVHSARGQGRRSGYVALSGTSMSSPAVAGVAALLMDGVPAYREQPAVMRARLMATAVRPDPWLKDGSGFALDNTAGPGPLQARFGMGKVSARTAVFDRDRTDGWTTGTATAELEDGAYAYRDIEVPEGAERLDVVMTWDEPPADAIASTVLNDLDLWLDRDADCETAACGEHVSRSRADSVEWILIKNPEPGTYRVKVLAHRVYTAPPRAAVAWTVVRGASTPTLALEADRERIPAGTHEVTLTLTSDAWVAAGTRLRVDCRGDGDTNCNDHVTVESVSLMRADGVAVSLEDEQGAVAPSGYFPARKPIDLGVPLPLGQVAAGDERKIILAVTVQGLDEGDEARLYFSASAWNARSGSASVGIGSADGTAPVLALPDNDAFAAATEIEGAEGARPVDLLRATAEPGEPPFDARTGRPPASVWYTWTAPADGAFRFRVPPLASDFRSRDGVARFDRVHVFTGDGIAALEEVTAGLWHATFFTEEGSTYRIRVSGVSRATPMELRWSSGDRPVNDDFVEAIVLEGKSGSFDGTTAGATLEAGESFGGLSATTWFRWVAPDDGYWEFYCPGRHVLVFAGNDLPDLRLVGAMPSSIARVPVAAGREYRIAVAEADGAGLGGDYALRWYSANYGFSDNDAFADALAVGEDAPSELGVDADRDATVETGEPDATGVRTQWWSWQAPEDGLYTWRLEDVGERVPSYPKLRVSLWTGADLDDLELAAEIGPGAPFETLLDALAGGTYWIAVGLRNGDRAAYRQSRVLGRLHWGVTPEHDDRASASVLTGASGSITGSTTFATGARGERSAVLGRSTLWWTHETETSGWVRFAVDGAGGPWALTVHRASSDGLGGLDVLASSVWQRSDGDAVEVRFEAEAGVEYTIALGVGAGGTGGAFTLRWDEAEAPTWLRYVGALADGDTDAGGDAVEIRGPADLALHADGSALYLASEIGLQVYERDTATGRLDHAQTLEGDLDFKRASMAWDTNGDRLLVDDCGTWRSFTRVEDGPELEDQGEVAVEGDPGTCGNQLLPAVAGGSLYRVGGGKIEHFAVEEGGDLQFVQAFEDRFVRAVLSNDGEYVYAAARSRLKVFNLDAETGALEESDFEHSIAWPRSEPLPLAITDDDSHLFLFDNSGERANLFSLADPANPERLARLSRFWQAPYQSNRCRFGDARGETVTVDVLCPSLAFTVQWEEEAGVLAGTDFVIAGEFDRFHGPTLPDFGTPADLAASPDDRHLYASTPLHGILIFARDLAPVAESPPGGTPDIVIQRAWTSQATVAAGASFRLHALARNRGDGPAVSATLRFYRSADGTISSSDAEVGALPLDPIAGAATRSRSVEVTASSVAGDYFYGACVDGVANESDTGNNCSAAVPMTVTEGDPDLVVQAISVDTPAVDPGASFTLSATVLNQGHGVAPATTVRYYRSDDTSVSPADTEVGTDAIGEIAPGSDNVTSADIKAPMDAGTAYYGACVDAVADESDTGNNCSASVAVTVRDIEVGS
ncbi:MAG: S8 family serine peptidase [Gammaproteobacteria bacterium]|nr:S8 family serine peptidase [Gammaproteobacteria bacterium]